MKFSNILFALASITILATSCKKNTSNSVLAPTELSTQLRSSLAFNRYMLFTTRLERGIIAGKYNLTKENQKNVDVLMQAQKKETLNQICQDLTTAGIDNSKEFIFLNINAHHYRNVLIQEFPQLKNMAPKEAVSLFNNLYFKEMNHPKPDLASLLEQRKINIALRNKISSPIQ